MLSSPVAAAFLRGKCESIANPHLTESDLIEIPSSCHST